MNTDMSGDRVTTFLERFEIFRPMYFRQVRTTYDNSPGLFSELAEPMLDWAQSSLGTDYIDVLIEGYCEFVTDVNRCQLRYEANGEYEAKSYAEVFQETYDSSDFMSLYHWGVYTTTFSWAHHLELYAFFRDHFLSRLRHQGSAGHLVDLGCGSGIWHLLTLKSLDSWRTTAIDISKTSVALSRKMCQTMRPPANVEHIVDDALSYQPCDEAQAALSCFLLEHLEDPLALLQNLARCVGPRRFAFVTCALTAAETDHIYEFRRESEVLRLAEQAGFRILAMLSTAPAGIDDSNRFLPRSLGMVLQKRGGEIW